MFEHSTANAKLTLNLIVNSFGPVPVAVIFVGYFDGFAVGVRIIFVVSVLGLLLPYLFSLMTLIRYCTQGDKVTISELCESVLFDILMVCQVSSSKDVSA